MRVLLCLALVISLVNASTDRRVLVWLYDCSQATLDALQNRTDSFTAISPSLYRLLRDESTGMPSLVDVGGADACIGAIKKTLPSIEIWPWITSPDSNNNTADDALMRDLFAHPMNFTAQARSEAARLGMHGLNVDFEVYQQAPNKNATFWSEGLKWGDAFAAGAGVPVTFDVDCTANVTNLADWKECMPTATPSMVKAMQSSRMDRFVSMGTYGNDPALLLDQMDWFESNLHGKWGMGACPTCDEHDPDHPGKPETPQQLLLRFGTAHAYGVREIDLFAFDSDHEAAWAEYWPFMRAFLKCGKSTASGSCWNELAAPAANVSH